MAIGIILGIILFVLTIGAGMFGYFMLDENKTKNGLIAWALCVVFALTFIFVPFSFSTIQTGEIAVVKHLGKAVEVKQAGIHYDFWLTHSYVRYDTKVREIKVEDAAYSSDAQQMAIQGKFQYKIMANKALDITKEYGSLKTLESRINAIVIERAKASLSNYKAMDIIANRAQLAPSIEKMVKEALGKEYYVDVVAFSITNIDFSDAFESAVEEKMIAEQKQLKAAYEAEAKVVTAEATAKANELLEKSLTDKILQEMYINKWDGKLPQVVSDGNTLFQIPSGQ